MAIKINLRKSTKTSNNLPPCVGHRDPVQRYNYEESCRGGMLIRKPFLDYTNIYINGSQVATAKSNQLLFSENFFRDRRIVNAVHRDTFALICFCFFHTWWLVTLFHQIYLLHCLCSLLTCLRFVCSWGFSAIKNPLKSKSGFWFHTHANCCFIG